MNLSPSAHADTFARDNLPPADQWPVLEFTTEDLHYPDRLNAATHLIDVPVATFGADRPALRTPDGEVWTYGELQRLRGWLYPQKFRNKITWLDGSNAFTNVSNNTTTFVAQDARENSFRI